MPADYRRLRDSLLASLRNTQGVISVGITKEGGQLALTVIVDSNLSERARGQIPRKYQDMAVIVKDLGDAKAQAFLEDIMVAVNIDDLNDAAAVEALCSVAHQWLRRRGFEAYQVYSHIGEATPEELRELPGWVRSGPGDATGESGEFARAMLRALRDGADDEVREWTSGALEMVHEPRAHVLDPLTLGIGGLVLIGAILAARVRKIGPVEFYEGIPKNLSDVLKAGANCGVVGA